VFDFNGQPDATDARVRVAAATRRIIDELARSTADDTSFVDAAELVAQAAAILAERPHGREYSGAEASLQDHQDLGFINYSPFIGVLNPLAPPISMRVDGDGDHRRIIGTVRYPDAYEGPPGHVHGGFIAAGFDEVCGFAQSFAAQAGMTGRLTVSYRSPTPLHRSLTYTAWVQGIDGRKITVLGELHTADDQRLCAEAEGLFISMRPEAFKQLIVERGSAGGRPDQT
jgi:acyl-coenzyme A thioesterase PaaI-like protein